MMIRRSARVRSSVLFAMLLLVAFLAALVIGCDDDDNSAGPDNSNTVTDIDGNVYQTIQIGDQIWMAENLRVMHYRNGDSIPNVTDATAWGNLTAGGWSIYNHDLDYVADYGFLYNWYAVDDSRDIAPVGWHVPSDSEWMALEMYLGMSEAQAGGSGWRGTDEGGKLRETGADHWNAPNTGATDEFGFDARPGGMRHMNGLFQAIGTDDYFWTSSTIGPDQGWLRSLCYSNTLIYRENNNWRYGLSVRCVKDAE